MIATHPVGKPELAAAADRFADSFKLTAPSADPLARLEAKLPGSKLHGTPDETGWYPARSVNGRFSVRGPAPLVEAETDVENGRGTMIGTQKLPERIKFTAMCIVSSKPDGPDEFVAKVGPVDVRRDITFQGRPAIEVEMGNRSAFAVFDEDRMCFLAVEPVSKTTPRPTADVRRFYDSLVLED